MEYSPPVSPKTIPSPYLPPAPPPTPSECRLLSLPTEILDVIVRFVSDHYGNIRATRAARADSPQNVYYNVARMRLVCLVFYRVFTPVLFSTIRGHRSLGSLFRLKEFSDGGYRGMVKRIVYRIIWHPGETGSFEGFEDGELFEKLLETGQEEAESEEGDSDEGAPARGASKRSFADTETALFTIIFQNLPNLQHIELTLGAGTLGPGGPKDGDPDVLFCPWNDAFQSIVLATFFRRDLHIIPGSTNPSSLKRENYSPQSSGDDKAITYFTLNSQEACDRFMMPPIPLGFPWDPAVPSSSSSTRSSIRSPSPPPSPGPISSPTPPFPLPSSYPFSHLAHLSFFSSLLHLRTRRSLSHFTPLSLTPHSVSSHFSNACLNLLTYHLDYGDDAPLECGEMSKLTQLSGGSLRLPSLPKSLEHLVLQNVAFDADYGLLYLLQLRDHPIRKFAYISAWVHPVLDAATGRKLHWEHIARELRRIFLCGEDGRELVSAEGRRKGSWFEMRLIECDEFEGGAGEERLLDIFYGRDMEKKAKGKGKAEQKEEVEEEEEDALGEQDEEEEEGEGDKLMKQMRQMELENRRRSSVIFWG